jgi:hypothetical protein
MGPQSERNIAMVSAQNVISSPGTAPYLWNPWNAISLILSGNLITSSQFYRSQIKNMLQASCKWKWAAYLFCLWYTYILFNFNYKKYMKGVVAEGELERK